MPKGARRYVSTWVHSDIQLQDRYNRHFDILSGWNLIQVSLADVERAPKGRLLDLTRIAGMGGVFLGKLARPRTIYQDDVKLIN